MGTRRLAEVDTAPRSTVGDYNWSYSFNVCDVCFVSKVKPARYNDLSRWLAKFEILR